MPYATVEELPPQVFCALLPEDRQAWMDAYNGALEATGNAEDAYHTAWEVLKDSPDLRLVEGPISVEEVDVQGEVVSVEGLLEAMPYFLRSGGLVFDRHSNRNVGTMFDYWPAEVDGVPAVKARTAVYQGQRVYDYVWEQVLEAVKDGRGYGFSVAGDKLRQARTCESGRCHNRVQGVHIFDLTLTPRPANRRAMAEKVNMMAKAQDYKEALRTYMAKGERTAEELIEHCAVCKDLYSTLMEKGVEVVPAKSMVKAFAIEQAGMAKDESVDRLMAILLDVRSQVSELSSKVAMLEGANALPAPADGAEAPQIVEGETPTDPAGVPAEPAEGAEGAPAGPEGGEPNPVQEEAPAEPAEAPAEAEEGAPAEEQAQAPEAPAEPAPAPEEPKKDPEELKKEEAQALPDLIARTRSLFAKAQRSSVTTPRPVNKEQAPAQAGPEQAMDAKSLAKMNPSDVERMIGKRK